MDKEVRLDFKKSAEYCNFDYLPEGLENKCKRYQLNENSHLIPREFLSTILAQYQIPEHTGQLLVNGLEAIENDEILFRFTQFLVQDMCTARMRCDESFYTNMTPGCMGQHSDLYSFLLLLACVAPSMKLLEERGFPKMYYENIPHQPLKGQLEKLVLHGDGKVQDFPWDMNFYTCSIFRLDRFLFIPHRFDDEFTAYRHVQTQQVIALQHGGLKFRSDGQRDGINEVFDHRSPFLSAWEETDDAITANRINPMGFTERTTTVINKRDWNPVLQSGDILLALHIPAGPGYTPERLKNSMAMAVDLFSKYFAEIPIKGFWSASWLYDAKLSLLLDNEKSNIVLVQRQFYNYPTFDGDGMLRYELFKNREGDPGDHAERFTTSLQKAAWTYMGNGSRFNTISMIVLKEEIEGIGNMPYITAADMEDFSETVDSHL
ncbi:acyltransferase domain-containing protein [Paenibacillus herberti]|uniref:acyltransferase domain-containing protein n=1 Tax=Paenibacillus herberti TaxID=1619309 RepID=UPI0015960407|nr:hypothetical protein [Paenibacillus herberti]